MACVDRVAKNGDNKAQGYKYAMATDVYDAVRGELAKRFVVILPTVLGADFVDKPTKSGGSLTYCTVRVRYDFTDAESGEVSSVVIFGTGSDSGDKSVYKAMTGATKNCLINTFLIPTGDDPENEPRPKPPPPQGLAAVKQQMRASPPSAQPQAPYGNPTHDRTLSFGFGSGKGTPIAALDDKSLAWYGQCLQRDLADASKSKWHDKTRQQLATLMAERDYRANALPEHSHTEPDDGPPPPSDDDAPPF